MCTDVYVCMYTCMFSNNDIKQFHLDFLPEIFNESSYIKLTVAFLAKLYKFLIKDIWLCTLQIFSWFHQVPWKLSFFESLHLMLIKAPLYAGHCSKQLILSTVTKGATLILFLKIRTLKYRGRLVQSHVASERLASSEI